MTPPECADAAPPGSAGDSFPCDVEAILTAKCRRCHNAPDVVAACVADKTCVEPPFPLLRWSDTRRDLGGARPLDYLYEVIRKGIMPYQPSATEGISPPVEKLTPAEKKTLEDWALACAPPGPGGCAGASR